MVPHSLDPACAVRQLYFLHYVPTYNPIGKVLSTLTFPVSAALEIPETRTGATDPLEAP